MYVIRTPTYRSATYYVGSTSNTTSRFDWHKAVGELVIKQSHLCGFVAFDQMADAYCFEQAFHRTIRTHGYDGIPYVIKLYGGLWEDNGALKMERADTVVQSAVNRRVLARIALYFKDHGERPRSMSEMIREVLNTFDAILDQQGAETVDSADYANQILKEMFKAQLNPKDRYLKSFLLNLQDEIETVESREARVRSIPMPRGRRPKEGWTDADTQRSMNIIAEQLKKRGLPIPGREQ